MFPMISLELQLCYVTPTLSPPLEHSVFVRPTAASPPLPHRAQTPDTSPPCFLSLSQVPRSEASAFGASHHVAYFEASAKLRLNVDEAFEQLVRAVR